MVDRFIKMENGEEIEFPLYEKIEDRINFCEELIKKYPEDFEYFLPTNKNKWNFIDRVIWRLDALGYYLCELQNKKDKNMITEWQEKFYQQNKINPKKGRFYVEIDDFY